MVLKIVTFLSKQQSVCSNHFLLLNFWACSRTDSGPHCYAHCFCEFSCAFVKISFDDFDSYSYLWRVLLKPNHMFDCLALYTMISMPQLCLLSVSGTCLQIRHEQKRQIRSHWPHLYPWRCGEQVARWRPLRRLFYFILTAHTAHIKSSTITHPSFCFPETQDSVLSASAVALQGIDRECSYWNVLNDGNSFVFILPNPPSCHPRLYLSILPVEQLPHLHFTVALNSVLCHYWKKKTMQEDNTGFI